MSAAIPHIWLVAGPDTGQEFEALRQHLEYLGFGVRLYLLNRPQSLVDLLTGKVAEAAHYPYWVFSVHGEEENICLPELATDVYLPEEPRKGLSAEWMVKNGQLPGPHVLSSGCELGTEAWGTAMLAAGAESYTASTQQVEGAAALIFMQRFFYELQKTPSHPQKAFQLAQAMDEETGSFVRVEKGKGSFSP